MENYVIRGAAPNDAEALSAIYAYYVSNSAATFEYEPPTVEEFAGRIENAAKKYPYLVIEDKEKICGFAFAHAFRERSAYDYSAETTIYLHRGERHKGLGRLIYTALERELKRMGVKNLYACVALPNSGDNFLNNDSPSFHTALGYRECGSFYNCGYKFGCWYTMIWMEKLIDDFPEKPEPIIPYPELLARETWQRTKALFSCDNKVVRLVTKRGEVFFGNASLSGAHKDGVQIASYSFLMSDIKSIEILE